MGVRFPSVTTNTFIGPFPANATETLCMTTPGIAEPVDNAQVLIFWTCAIIAGTGVTAVTIRIRRGATVASPDISSGGLTQTIAAAAGGIFSGFISDSPGIVAGQQYSLTMVQTGASAASAPGLFTMAAMVL